jgi:hypothetical protein
MASVRPWRGGDTKFMSSPRTLTDREPAFGFDISLVLFSKGYIGRCTRPAARARNWHVRCGASGRRLARRGRPAFLALRGMFQGSNRSAEPSLQMTDHITPILLTCNEEQNIARTLSHLTWAKDIVVGDSGSTDGTLGILAKFSQRARVQPASTLMPTSGAMRLRRRKSPPTGSFVSMLTIR